MSQNCDVSDYLPDRRKGSSNIVLVIQHWTGLDAEVCSRQAIVQPTFVSRVALRTKGLGMGEKLWTPNKSWTLRGCVTS